MKASKDVLFSQLVREVHACRKCERMCESARVLSFAAGNLNASVLFVGEAPGRLGADQTEIPFHGDAAGKNFEDLLAVTGLRRDAVFVTNAALCNPKDAKGNNAPPTVDELQNCSAFLQRQIELVNPDIVVTLGAAALKAAALIEDHGLVLAQAVRTGNKWFGRTLVPLYHPGQRAMVHRSLANQRSDYQFVSELARRGSQRRRTVTGSTRADVLAACKYLLSAKGEVSYFELHKFIYLAEYLYVRKTGKRLTSAYFVRQKDGPYCADIHVSRLRRSDPSITTRTKGAKLFIGLRGARQAQLLAEPDAVDATLKATLDDVVARYSFSSEADLKKAVYLTAPMRLMLRREQQEKINLYNAPIDFMAVRTE